jgi:hypothetical protein
MYMKSIQRLHSIYMQHWGAWRRTLPAHAPHYLKLAWLKRLQAELPGEFQQTSAAQLRCVDTGSTTSVYAGLCDMCGL